MQIPMDRIVKRILENITRESYTNLISEDDFKEIIDIKSTKKLAFIDGGNLEIFKSPSISLFFSRIYYCIYSSNKRIKNHVVEFYTLITTKSQDDKILYNTEYLFTKNRLKLKSYDFDSSDKLLTTGHKRASISVIGDIIRRFAELTVMQEINDAFIVLDGDLEAVYPFVPMSSIELPS